MKPRSFILFPILFFLLPERAGAQRYFFDNYNIQNGLTQSQAMGVCQDQFNNLWIATLGGVSRFDGQNFKSYAKEDGLISNLALCILSDQDHKIWIGTTQGISEFTGNHFINYPSQSFVTTLAEDRDHGIWSLQGNKLMRISSGRSSSVTITDPAEIVTCLSADPQHIIWAAVLGKGVYCYVNNTWVLKQSFSGVYHRLPVSKIRFNRKNPNLFYLLHNDSLLVSENGELSLIQSFDGITLADLAQDENGKIWLGTSSGVFVLDQQKLVRYNAINGFCDNKIMQLFSDREGYMWICTDGKGIYKFNGDSFRAFSEMDGHPSPVVTGMEKMPDNTVYIGTRDQGIYYWKDEKLLPLHIPSADPALRRVNCLFAQDDTLWAGTDRGGIIRVVRGKPIVINPPSADLHHIIAIRKDVAGRLWLGEIGGCYLFSGGKIQLMGRFPNKLVSCITPLSRDSLLIGTEHGMFWLLHDTQVVPCRLPYLDSSTVAQVTRSGGYTFIASLDNGLLVWDEHQNRVKSFGMKDGLISGQVYSVYVDRQRKIWLGTGKGIQSASLDVVTFALKPDDPNVFPTAFKAEYNPDCIMEDSLGTIWAGSTQGVFIFKKSLQPRIVQPHLLLESVLVLSKPVTDKQYFDTVSSWYNIPYGLSLPYGKNHLTFQFRGITMSDSRSVSYQYKLDGLDKEYSPPGTVNYVVYPALPPGHYTFRVKTISGQQPVSEEVLFPFEIRRPFYETTLFIVAVSAAAVFFITGLIWYAIRRRERRRRLIELLREEEQNKIRQQTSEDFHDELGNKLTRITVLTDILSTKLATATPEEKKLLLQIKENAALLYSGTKDILWSLHPGSDNLYDVLRHVADLGAELFESTPVLFTVIGLDDAFKKVKLPMDYGRNILMICKEALNNILKHSNGKQVVFSMEPRPENRVRISLSDDGRGFDTEAVKKGNGLRNMQGRAERIHASLAIDTAATGGTTISLELKYP